MDKFFDVLLSIMIGVIVHHINKWLDREDNEAD